MPPNDQTNFRWTDPVALFQTPQTHLHQDGPRVSTNRKKSNSSPRFVTIHAFTLPHAAEFPVDFRHDHYLLKAAGLWGAELEHGERFLIQRQTSDQCTDKARHTLCWKTYYLFQTLILYWPLDSNLVCWFIGVIHYDSLSFVLTHCDYVLDLLKLIRLS